MRFRAPADVSAITLNVGEFDVVKGYVDLPEDIDQGDLAGLAANGFVYDPSPADLKAGAAPADGAATAAVAIAAAAPEAA